MKKRPQKLENGAPDAPKSSPGGSKIDLRRPPSHKVQLIVLFVASWAALGALLACFWRLLAPLGPLLAPLGPLLGLMLASRGLHLRDFEGCFTIALANM